MPDRSNELGVIMSDTQTESREDAALAQIKEAMKGEVRLCIVYTFTHGDAVAVEAHKRGASPKAGWKQVGPLIFPPTGGTTADVLAMLVSFRNEATS